MATWDDVRRSATALPEVTERGPHEWRVHDKNLAWERPLRPADLAALGADAPAGDILGVRVQDVGVAEALVADDPAVYFTTPHFAGYPAVLVRLAEIDPGELDELIRDAWLARAPKRTAKAWLAARGRETGG
ncbi:MmcQ/YjbR family DNA-binding protein [Actinoplanes sp. NPDC049681]|uniref:MmcQ/YjbR family DNA-binding protein n=1 Tax=Actinoplanes sp. NPDC049681 TaxID=3363905 RepID=UPI0037B39C58